MSVPKILIVDDERNIRLTLRLALETSDYSVREAATLNEAVTALQTDKFDLVVLDLRLGENSGLDILTQMREQSDLTPVLMVTAYGSIRQAVRAMQLGAIDFLEKPIEPAALRSIVADVLGRHQARPYDVAPGSFEDCLREAKQLINLQQFKAAADQISAALKLDGKSPEAHNLQGILQEISGDYNAARKAYGQAVKLDSRHEGAQQNMRRLFELFHFGSSEETFHLGT